MPDSSVRQRRLRPSWCSRPGRFGARLRAAALPASGARCRERKRRGELRMGRVAAGMTATYKHAESLGDRLGWSYEPMFAWDFEGPIEFWSAGAARLYGFTADEAIGRSSHALLQTKWPITLADLLARLRADGHWSGELRHVCKDGREVTV